MAALLGRYELLRPLAKGGMATVYLARVVGEGGFERLVALKLMHPHIAGEPDFVSMFLDEARLAARIRHANVVPTLAVERGDDGLFLVLEYVEGHALHTLVGALARRRVEFPIGIVLRIVTDMLEGLHAAHELTGDDGAPLHLVHRDVSPHNVLVGKDGVSRITDFGVAHARARLATTQGASLKGKVSYLSPEQITSGQVDRRCDLFAAGIVLWEMLALRRLFRGDTEGQTLAQILAGAPQSPAEANPRVPEAVSEACMKALEPNPEQRFQTAIEMAEGLERAARASGIEIAKPREVGAFLAQLNIPEATADGGKLPSSSTSIRFGSASQPQSGTAEPIVASSPAKQRASRSPLYALGALALVLTVVAVGLVARMAGGGRTASSSARPSVPGAGVTDTGRPEPERSAAAPAPARSTVTAEATASADPAPSSQPPASAAPSAEVAASAPVGKRQGPLSGGAAKPPAAKPALKGPATKGGAGYRPDEL